MTAELSASLGNDVFAAGHKKVGKVASLVRDDSGQTITAIDVEYGMLRHHARRVSANRIKWVNPKNVVLELTVDEFRALPEQTAPAPNPQAAQGKLPA